MYFLSEVYAGDGPIQYALRSERLRKTYSIYLSMHYWNADGRNLRNQREHYNKKVYFVIETERYHHILHPHHT